MKIIFSDEQMNLELESEWIKIKQRSRFYSKYISSLELIWKDVTFDAVPAPFGELKLYYSNSMNVQDEFYLLAINSSDNLSSPELLEINSAFAYLKIHYLPNDILNGKLNIVANIN